MIFCNWNNNREIFAFLISEFPLPPVYTLFAQYFAFAAFESKQNFPLLFQPFCWPHVIKLCCFKVWTGRSICGQQRRSPNIFLPAIEMCYALYCPGHFLAGSLPVWLPVWMAMAKQDTELVALLYPACPAVNCCYFNAIFKWNANCLMISIGKLLEYLTRGTSWYQERQINHFGVAINECSVIIDIDIEGIKNLEKCCTIYKYNYFANEKTYSYFQASSAILKILIVDWGNHIHRQTSISFKF